MTNATDEIEAIIKAISYEIKADAVYVLSNGSVKIHTHFTSYANVGMTTTEGYKVVDFKLNEYITLKVSTGTTIETGDTITLPTPDFYAGKYKRVQEEIKKNNLIGLKPYLWLFELSSSNYQNQWDTNLQEIAKIRLFIIGSTKSQNNPKANREEVIKTLRNGIWQPMIDYMNCRRDRYRRVNSLEETNHETFTTKGTSIKGTSIQGGAEAMIFSNNNSAIEIKFDLHIRKKTYICK